MLERNPSDIVAVLDLLSPIASVSAATWESLIELARDMAPQLLAAMSGAFCGAYLAYRFARQHQERIKQDADFSAGVLSQYILLFKIDMVVNIQRQWVHSLRNDPETAQALTVFSVSSRDIQIDYKTLAFLATSKSPGLLHDIYLAEGSYCTVLDAIAERNTFVEKMRDSSTNSAHAIDAEGLMLADIYKADHKLLRDMTDAVCGSVDDSIIKLRGAFDELRNTLKERFPKDRFSKYRLLRSASTEHSQADPKDPSQADTPER